MAKRRHSWLGRSSRLLTMGGRELARPLGIESLPTHFNGEWIWAPRRVWPGVWSHYESYLAKLLRRHLHPGDTFIDVGAHFGFWSLYAATLVGPNGCVISCEPSPDVYEILLESAKHSKVVTPLPVGLGSYEGTALFAAQGASTGGSFCRKVTEISRRWWPRVPVVELPVQMRSLDAVVQELAVTPTVIKIDVEGFELEVVQGAAQTLTNHGCVLLIEVHPYQLKLSAGSEELLQDFLAARGYRWTVIDRNPNTLYTVLATKAG